MTSDKFKSETLSLEDLSQMSSPQVLELFYVMFAKYFELGAP